MCTTQAYKEHTSLNTPANNILLVVDIAHMQNTLSHTTSPPRPGTFIIESFRFEVEPGAGNDKSTLKLMSAKDDKVQGERRGEMGRGEET